MRFGGEVQHVVIFPFAIHGRVGLLLNAFAPSVTFDRHEPQAMTVTKEHILLPAYPTEPRRQMPTQIELIFSKPKSLITHQPEAGLEREHKTPVHHRHSAIASIRRGCPQTDRTSVPQSSLPPRPWAACPN